MFGRAADGIRFAVGGAGSLGYPPGRRQLLPAADGKHRLLHLEESVARATNIVEARCVERTFDGRNSWLRFEILSQIKGTADEELTVVFPHYTDEVVTGENRLSYSFSEESCPYRPGMEYMLLLIEYDELYEPSVSI